MSRHLALVTSKREATLKPCAEGIACMQRQAGNFSHLCSPSVQEAGSLPPKWASAHGMRNEVHIRLKCLSRLIQRVHLGMKPQNVQTAWRACSVKPDGYFLSGW